MAFTTMKTSATKSMAGKVSRGMSRQYFLAVLVAIAAAPAWGQPIPMVRGSAVSTPAAATPAPAAATPLVSGDRESSLTVQQIVARQEDHFSRIKNAQGIAVHSEVRYNEQAQPQPAQVQYIFFAYEGPRSVTLSMPKNAAQAYKGSQGQIPWDHITAAHHVTGDAVYMIRKAEGASTSPLVFAVPFNPAVHENNPLVSFHLRQVSNEQIPLRELARAIPAMAERPRVYDVSRDGKQLVRIDFANPNTPGEALQYLIDPARGYLPVEIIRRSGQRPVSVSKIIIGNTPDGTWVPARRERTMYDASGRTVSRQNWHYEHLAVNQGLAPKALSLMYFNLPMSTPVTVIEGNQTVAQPAGSIGTPAGQGAGARPAMTPVSTPTPIPPRSIATPRRFQLN